jgi:hypothetical protein
VNGDFTPLLVAAAVGLPVLFVGVLALGRIESWRERHASRRRRRRDSVRR